MSCRLLLLLAVLVACTDDPLVVDVQATAREAVQLSPQAERLPDEEATYRWELIQAPEGSTQDIMSTSQAMVFTPDLRGIYVVDRWLAYGVSERLTHRFVVQVAGTAPLAAVAPAPTATVGTGTVLDGRASRSAEGRDLVFRWRLAARPLGSNATITAPDAALAELTPDVAGSYKAELSVFDGELWSNPATIDIAAQ